MGEVYVEYDASRRSVAFSDDYRPGTENPSPKFDIMFCFQTLVMRDNFREEVSVLLDAMEKMNEVMENTDGLIDYSDTVVVTHDIDLAELTGLKHDISIAETSFDEEYHAFIKVAFTPAFNSFKGMLRFMCAVRKALVGVSIEFQNVYTSDRKHDEFEWRSMRQDILGAAHTWFDLHTDYDNPEHFYALMFLNSLFFRNDSSRLFSMVDYIRTDKVLVESARNKMTALAHNDIICLDADDEVEIALDVPRKMLIRDYVILGDELTEDRFFIGVFFNDASCINSADDYSCFTNTTPTKYIIELLRNYTETQKIRQIRLCVYPETGKFAYMLDLGEKYILERDDYDSVVLFIMGIIEKEDDIEKELTDALHVIRHIDYSVKISEELSTRLKKMLKF